MFVLLTPWLMLYIPTIPEAIKTKRPRKPETKRTIAVKIARVINDKIE